MLRIPMPARVPLLGGAFPDQPVPLHPDQPVILANAWPYSLSQRHPHKEGIISPGRAPYEHRRRKGA